MSTITAHCLVRNEERYVWYAVMSVINYVDRVLLWDTGSVDKTPEILKAIKKVGGSKVDLQFLAKVNPSTFTQVRQRMFEKTKTDWFIIVDGDEVWWDNSIDKVVRKVKKSGNFLESIVTPYFNIVGDIYHHQNEQAGMYRIDNKRGHINIRATNCKIPGLHFAKPHGQLGLLDKENILIQNRTRKKRLFVNAYYLHFTNVIRSSSRKLDLGVPKRDLKFKYELGIPFPDDFYYPEVFFRQRPDFIPSPWENSSFTYKLRASLEIPIRWIKRRVIKKSKIGY